jgi:nucleoid-associated protein YgaU
VTGTIRELPSPEVVMSPQPASTQTVVDFASARHRSSGSSALAPEACALPDVFETLVISAVPPFERAAALRAVPAPLTVSRPGSSRLAAVTTDSARASQPIRLTRRGRLVLLITAITLMLFGFSIGKSVSFASTVPAPATGTQTVVVQPGETLWAIATQVAPKTDPRVTIQRIIALNGLRNSDILAGQQLALPS